MTTQTQMKMQYFYKGKEVSKKTTYQYFHSSFEGDGYVLF